MSLKHTSLFLRKFGFACAIFVSSVFVCTTASAQIDAVAEDIDPRLVEVVQIVKARASENSNSNLRGLSSPTRDELYLDIFNKMQTAFYSSDDEEVKKSLDDFQDAYKQDATLDLSRVYSLHSEYAEHLLSDATSADLQNFLSEFSANGNWFERYVALSMSARLHGTGQERQAALQKAQLALSIIPAKPDQANQLYVSYAKARITSLIANLHNLQGNSELALLTSLDYLKLTKDNPDSKLEVDLINNLIYSYSVGRNHEAQLYLSEQLLEIEESRTSSVQGLSEMRISGVMNSVGRFEEALDYADRSLGIADNSIVIRVSRVNKSIALAGAGRLKEAKENAKLANVNFAPEHMLSVETRQSDLYLAFLLAQFEDREYATQLFNRQLDVTAQKFLANNSRDTTTMLAELENSRERQMERREASAREAQLQAMTIDRQRKLNRALIFLTLLLTCVAIASFLFMKSREKLLRKLEIKTVEAASAEKLKTEFLGMISHELRTPLNGIIGISDFLANYHDDADIREKTGIVLRSGNELLSVVESLTDMARLDAGQLVLAPHNTDLAKSLDAVPEPWANKAAKKGLAFTHFIDPAISTHHVDEDRLIQCLNILLENAVRFTDKGRVHLHITGNEVGESGARGLTAIVADTGQGMSELIQSRLFTPFMQADTSRKRSHMGTGLSLAIAYALAEMMGGRLSVISREGRGSEFKLDIPLAAMTGPVESGIPAKIEDVVIAADEPATPTLPETELRETDVREARSILEPPVLDGPNAPKREIFDLMQPHSGFPSLHDVEELVLPMPKQGRQRILVVDDVDSNRDILRLILETEGHACREAADGFAALDLLDREAFDLVVLDIHMAPLDGVETLRRLRNLGKPYANIPVIALTADNAASTNAACMEAGADLFLTKPVRQDELLRAIGYLNQADGARILSQ